MKRKKKRWEIELQKLANPRKVSLPLELWQGSCTIHTYTGSTYKRKYEKYILIDLSKLQRKKLKNISI